MLRMADLKMFLINITEYDNGRLDHHQFSWLQCVLYWTYTVYAGMYALHKKLFETSGSEILQMQVQRIEEMK